MVKLLRTLLTESNTVGIRWRIGWVKSLPLIHLEESNGAVNWVQIFCSNIKDGVVWRQWFGSRKCATFFFAIQIVSMTIWLKEWAHWIPIWGCRLANTLRWTTKCRAHFYGRWIKLFTCAHFKLLYNHSNLSRLSLSPNTQLTCASRVKVAC